VPGSCEVVSQAMVDNLGRDFLRICYEINFIGHCFLYTDR